MSLLLEDNLQYAEKTNLVLALAQIRFFSVLESATPTDKRTVEVQHESHDALANDARVKHIRISPQDSKTLGLQSCTPR